MSFNTNNPVGSSDPRDLFDNSIVADRLVNGEDPAYNDRLGKARKSFSGMESEFTDFLVSSGYQFAGDYAAGIEITQYNQVVRDTAGEFWRASGSTALPYTTTGAGLPEGGAFVNAGDAVLRQELNGSPASGQGAALVNGATVCVGSVADLEALSLPVGTAVYLTEDGRAGEFVVKAGTPPSDPQKGVYVVLANGNYAERQYTTLTPYMFGVNGVDDSDALNAFFDYVFTNGELASCVGEFVIGKKVTIGRTDANFAEDSSRVTFGATFTTNFSSTTEAPVRLLRLNNLRMNGLIRVECGGADVSLRRNWYGIDVDICGSTELPGLMAVGAKVLGVRFSDRTSNSSCNSVRASQCGFIDSNTVASSSQTGTSDSVTQLESIVLNNTMPAELSTEDFILHNGLPYIIRGLDATANTIDVYPWLPSVSVNDTVLLMVGAGVDFFGGQTSIMTFGKIDVINSPVGARFRNLYPPNVQSFHFAKGSGFDGGIGFSIGRDVTDSSESGYVGNLYTETGTDVAIYQVTTAETKFFVGSHGSDNAGINYYGNPPSDFDRRVNFNVGASSKGLLSPTGGYSGDVSTAARVISNQSKASAFYHDHRNNITIQVSYDEAHGRATDSKSMYWLIDGDGANGEPTGTVTFEPADAGWTVNGLASMNVSGLNAPTVFIITPARDTSDWRIHRMITDRDLDSIRARLTALEP